MTKEELREYRYIQKEIRQLQEEIELLRTKLLAPPQPDGMPKSNYATDRMADSVAKIVDVSAVLQERVEKSLEQRAAMEVAMDSLPAEWRILMRYRYVEGMSWEEVAVAMGYTYRHVTRIHGWALQNMA